jgi:tRNA threonylcarbamoyladenosine modification (KEOPS) complex  Pcc1 subunit
MTMKQMFIALICLLQMACGQSCGTSDLELRLEGDWAYQLSEQEQIRQTAMDKILSESPPTESELRSMGLASSDLAAALETLRLKSDNPASQMLVEIEKDFRASSSTKKNMRLEVDGNRMVLVVGAKRMASTYTVASEDGDGVQIETVSSSGQVETQTLEWVSDTHFRLTDPSGRSMDFVRSGTP